MYDPNAWFVNESGSVRFLREFGPENVIVKDHGSWVEVEVLGPVEVWEPGREVVGSYQLHKGDPKIEMEKRR